jgi:hypothetical protein
VTDAGTVSFEALILIAFLSLGGAAEVTDLPDWVPSWAPSVVFMLGAVGAVYRAWPAIKRAGLWLADHVATAVLAALREDLAPVLVLPAHVEALTAEVAGLRSDVGAVTTEVDEVRTAMDKHSATSEESFGRLAAQTAGALAEHVHTHHRTGG